MKRRGADVWPGCRSWWQSLSVVRSSEGCAFVSLHLYFHWTDRGWRGKMLLHISNHTHPLTHTHTCLSCSGNTLQPRSWFGPTAHWGSVWPTRCPPTRRLDSRCSGAVGSCGERAAHPSRSRWRRRRSSGGSLRSDWQQQRKLQVPRSGRNMWILENIEWIAKYHLIIVL